MTNKQPKATRVSTSAERTLWRIDWPSTMTLGGMTYFATTYPDSDKLFIETAAKRRPVAANRATVLTGQIRAAIEAAKSN